MALPVAQSSSGIDLGSVLSALPATLDSFFGKTTTQSSGISAAGQNALLQQILSGNSGLASVTSGEHAAGLYNSSTNTLLTNDLLTRAAGEVASQNKTTTTVQQPQLNPLKTLGTTLLPSVLKSYGPQALKGITDAIGMTGPSVDAASAANGGAVVNGLEGAQSAGVGNFGSTGGVSAANFGTNVNLGAGATGTGTIAADSALGDSVLGGASGGSIELGTSLAGGALGAAGTAGAAGAVGAGTGAAITGIGGSILDGIAGYGAGAAGAAGLGIGGTIAADSALGAAAAGTAAGTGAALGAGAAVGEGAAAAGGAAAEGIGTAAAAEGGGDALAAIGTALVAAWVICTELQVSGEMPIHVYTQAAPDFNNRMKLKPSAVRGYHYWAVPYTRLMRKKTILGRISRAIIRPFAIGRAKYIAGNKNFLGWFTFSVLEPICSLLGNTLARKQQNWKSLYSQMELKSKLNGE